MYKVSLYQSKFETSKLRDVDLLQFLTTNHFKDVVENLRTATTEAEENKWKSMLPGITVSGKFGEYRRKSALLEHSGLLCIDVDEFQPGQSPESVKNLFTTIDETLFVGNSCRGNVFAILKIQPKDHLDAFLSLQELLKDNFDVVVDANCKDTTRLRFASYNEDYYYNEHCSVYQVPQWYRDKTAAEAKLILSNQAKMSFSDDLEAREGFYSECNRYLSECVKGNRDNWCILRAHRARTLYKLTKDQCTNVLTRFTSNAPIEMIQKCIASAYRQ